LANDPAFLFQPVQSREAVARRDRLIEKLASLPPVHGALDQIVQRFGTDIVAEVTGRSRRIIRKTGSDGVDRLVVENRAGSAISGETQAFMDDVKRILVFSDAGGTGRSYHAELSAKNRRLRVHYLLEAGWKADAAIQGLGRTNRTNQAQPPLFRPIATDVKAEKRFLSTIARRLDTLGAITRGQRQTGGQGLFRPGDNLESVYARDALRHLLDQESQRRVLRGIVSDLNEILAHFIRAQLILAGISLVVSLVLAFYRGAGTGDPAGVVISTLPPDPSAITCAPRVNVVTPGIG
jgi:hypothetical protein